MHQYSIELQSYKEQAVATMTQGEMLIVLYDEVIKRLKKAKILIENTDYTNAESELNRAQNIVIYLETILDRKYEISRNLAQLYRFFNLQMVRVIAGRNTELIDELIPLVEDLRDTFKQADVLSKQQSKQQA